MDLESQDPIFNANLGQDENLIWTKKLRCSHSNIRKKLKQFCQSTQVEVRSGQRDLRRPLPLSPPHPRAASMSPNPHPWSHQAGQAMGPHHWGDLSHPLAAASPSWSAMVDATGLGATKTGLC